MPYSERQAAGRLVRARASACLLLIPVGCLNGDRAGTEWIIRDSAGIEISENHAPQWTPGTGWRVSEEPLLQIGEVQGEEAFQFDRIVQVSRAANGNIVVADGGSLQIRIFDSSGSHIRTFGSSGRGPGEFIGINGFLLTGDTVLVLDASAQRLTYFSDRGEVLRTVQMEGSGSGIHPLRLYRLVGTVSDDLVLGAYAYPWDMRPEPQVYWDSMPTFLYSRSGSNLGSTAEYAGMETYSTPSRATMLVFGRLTSVDVEADRVYMTDGSRFEVRIYDPDRGLAAIVRAARPARPVTDAVISEYLEAQGGGADPVERQEIRALFDRTPKRDTLPEISTIKVDRVRNLWVREYRHRFDRNPPLWHVFGPAGRWYGGVLLHRSFVPHEIHDDELIGVARGQWGEEYVVVYSLEKSGVEGTAAMSRRRDGTN